MRIVIALLWLTMGALAQEPTDFKGWLAQGTAAFQRKEFREAEAAYRRAAALDPQSVQAQIYLAMSLLQQYVRGDASAANLAVAASAQTEFERVLVLQPDNLGALESLGSLARDRKQWDAATGWYEKLLALDPKNANAHFNLGYVAWSRTLPAYAEARQASGMKPDDRGPIPVPQARADLNARFSRTIADGLAHFEQALALNPNFLEAMVYTQRLLRQRASLRDTDEERQRDLALADEWAAKELASRKSMPSTSTQRLRIGGNVMQAKLIEQPRPVYPPEAKAARVQGTVKLNVIIAREGTIQTVTVISGEPLLVEAALAAVKQWRYQPTLLNGQPVEVVTQIDVNFTLSR